MKVRIKFKKYGVLRFIGHLDVMRHFQKMMRRTEIPIAFTGGYSPHMIMSFASPLGIGLTSDGEYADIELSAPVQSEEAIRRLNAVAADGIEIVSFRQISEEKKMTGMAIVAAADYLVCDRECMTCFGEHTFLKHAASGIEEEPGTCQAAATKASPFFEDWEDYLTQFAAQEEICVRKQTKRSEANVDIRPMIYRLEARENAIYMQLAAGSVKNLKPNLVMDAFFTFAKAQKNQEVSVPLACHRLELYADMGNETEQNLVTLESLGEAIK